MRATTLLTITFLTSIAGLASISRAAETTPVGYWRLFDEQTKQPYAIVEISENKGEYRGYIRKLFPQPGENSHPLCTKCPRELKDKPMQGMQIIAGLQRIGDHYDNGSILDPEEGKIYRCQIKVLEEGKKLAVLAYVGSPAFGYTEIWSRESGKP